MIINSRSRVSNLLFSNSCINWLNATLATPGLLAMVRNASLCVRRADMPIASPRSRARSSDTIGTRAVILALPLCPLLRLQRHHAHPEHGLVANVDIVLARETQLAVIADAEHRQTGGYCLHRIAIFHIHRQVVLRDQQASAWVDV